MTETTNGAGGDPAEAIVFQGYAGAYSDLACRQVYPGIQVELVEIDELDGVLLVAGSEDDDHV